MERAQAGHAFHAFSAPSANGRSAGKEKGDVAAQLSGPLGKLVARPTELPTFVGGHQCRRGVTRSTAQTCHGGDAFHQPKIGATANLGALPDQLDRSEHEVPGPFGHFVKAAAARTAAPENPPAPQLQPSVGVLLEVQCVVYIDRAHERFNLMIPVATLGKHLEEQIELRGSLDHQLHR